MAAAPFGKVSVVMIALAAACQASRSGVRDAAGHDAAELLRIERLADHAGRGEEDFDGLQSAAAAAISAVSTAGLAAGFAGKGVGVAGIDHQRARRSAA